MLDDATARRLTPRDPSSPLGGSVRSTTESGSIRSESCASSSLTLRRSSLSSRLVARSHARSRPLVLQAAGLSARARSKRCQARPEQIGRARTTSRAEEVLPEVPKRHLRRSTRSEQIAEEQNDGARTKCKSRCGNRSPRGNAADGRDAHRMLRVTALLELTSLDAGWIACRRRYPSPLPGTIPSRHGREEPRPQGPPGADDRRQPWANPSTVAFRPKGSEAA